MNSRESLEYSNRTSDEKYNTLFMFYFTSIYIIIKSIHYSHLLSGIINFFYLSSNIYLFYTLRKFLFISDFEFVKIQSFIIPFIILHELFTYFSPNVCTL